MSESEISPSEARWRNYQHLIWTQQQIQLQIQQQQQYQSIDLSLELFYIISSASHIRIFSNNTRISLALVCLQLQAFFAFFNFLYLILQPKAIQFQGYYNVIALWPYYMLLLFGKRV